MSEQSRSTTRSRPRGPSRHFAMATVAGLLVAMWLPLVAVWTLPRPTLSFTEKRFLAKWPGLPSTREDAVAWPGDVEAWFDDNLGLRDWLIRNWARLQIGVFGISPAELTIVGKDGWLFLGDRDAVANYRGLAPLSAKELEVWRRTVKRRHDWLKERGIAYLLVLVPDKHLVYDEYMPDSLPRTTEVHPLDQLARHLEARTDVEILDLLGPLREAKAHERLYHKTDSHWNDAGAYEAYRLIHARLQTMLPALADVPPAPVARGRHRAPGMGLASVLGMTDRYSEEVVEARLVEPRATIRERQAPTKSQTVDTLRPITYASPDRSLPRAVVFRDSFGNALIPYLAEDFSHVVFVWDRDVDPSLVLRERPDVVIQEIVGRFLGRRPKDIVEVKNRRSRIDDR